MIVAKKKNLLLIVRLSLDILIISLSFVLGWLIKFNDISAIFSHLATYAELLLLTISIWLIIFNLGGLYRFPRTVNERTDGPIATSMSITSAAFINLAIILFVYREASFAVDIVMSAWLISLVLINLYRYLLWKIYK